MNSFDSKLLLVAMVYVSQFVFANAGPPPRPQSLTAESGGDRSVILRWESVPEAVELRIYRSNTQNDNEASLAGTCSADLTEYVVSDLPNDSTHYFKIRAVGSSEELSDPSPEAVATTAITKSPFPDGVYCLAPRLKLSLRLEVGEKYRILANNESAINPEQQLKLTNVGLALYEARSLGGNKSAQIWRFVPVESGFRIDLGDSKKSLTIEDSKAGAHVDFSEEAVSMSQTWSVLPVSESESDPLLSYVPDGYELVFGDEFIGNEIDLDKWEPLSPWSQPHLNRELENYLPEAISIEGGFCVITADRHESTCFLKDDDPIPHCNGVHEYRSGSITSRNQFSHGYFEARIKLPHGFGLWPAFWVTSSKRWPPEWDILEAPHINGTIYQYPHPVRGAKQTWVKGLGGMDATYNIKDKAPNIYDGFVVYGCETTPEGVRMWVNGELTADWKISEGTIDPMWVAANLAIGGDWAGSPDETTEFPAKMLVDYIRVYQSAEVGKRVDAVLSTTVSQSRSSE